MIERGRFIVFEGLDGSGSTTQANLLYERLIKSDRRAWLTSEPSSGPVGQTIRLFFSGRVILPQDRETQDKLFAYLFAADRFDHLHNPTSGINSLLEAGVDVICTRFVLSSFAYNGETPDEEDLVRRLNAEFKEPDFLIYLDCPVDVAIHRMSLGRPNRDTYENRQKLARVSSNFKKILQHYHGTKLVINACLSPKRISNRVFEFVVNGSKKNEVRAGAEQVS